MTKPPLILAVLISGGGRTLLNLHNRIKRGRLDARIERVICSRVGAVGVARAREVGLPTTIIDRAELSAETFQRRLTEAVAEAEVDLVCMAGFLSLWTIPQDHEGRVINIHPALLPDFGGAGMYGLHVHRAVLASGRRESGCTVHFCDNQYDHGPIILQKKIPVLPTDTPQTLADRVFEQECVAFPQAIQKLAEDRTWRQGTGRVPPRG